MAESPPESPPLVLSRELARRWWRAELYVTDAAGRVPEHVAASQSAGALPLLPAPDNDVCTASLRQREGLRRCDASIGFAAQRATSQPDTAISHPCHLGFVLVARALDARSGAAVLCGLRDRPLSGEPLEATRLRVLEMNPKENELTLAPVAAHDADALERARDFVHLAAEVARSERDPMPATVRTTRQARRPADAPVPFIGRSLAMLEVQRVVERVATSDTTVLVQGESGTGKELVARQIHDRGARREGPFIAQNCSALNDNLLESALFGHVRGAFTGASRDTRGLFELADGGTLFLDEIGDMSASLQAKLLRVLQEGTFTPVGGSEERHSDVRIIAATHKDLAAEVRRGTFREDLYYRVNVIRLELPALRDREDDVLVLASHFLRARSPDAPLSLDDEVTRLFLHHRWPGNVRELQNEIERMVVLGGDRRVLGVDLVSPRIVTDSRKPPAEQAFEPSTALPKLADALETLERTLITESLRRCKGNRTQVARELGMARSNLILKLRRYRLI